MNLQNLFFLSILGISGVLHPAATASAITTVSAIEPENPHKRMKEEAAAFFRSAESEAEYSAHHKERSVTTTSASSSSTSSGSSSSASSTPMKVSYHEQVQKELAAAQEKLPKNLSEKTRTTRPSDWTWEQVQEWFNAIPELKSYQNNVPSFCAGELLVHTDPQVSPTPEDFKIYDATTARIFIQERKKLQTVEALFNKFPIRAIRHFQEQQQQESDDTINFLTGSLERTHISESKQ